LKTLLQQSPKSHRRINLKAPSFTRSRWQPQLKTGQQNPRNQLSAKPKQLRQATVNSSILFPNGGCVVWLDFKIIVAAIGMLLISNASLGQNVAVVSGESRPQAGNSLPYAQQAITSKLTVNYKNGKLAVLARGVTLQSVLEVIAQRTGTRVEAAAAFDPAQVFVELGPSTVHDLLADLLNGSSANYVLIGSPTNPGFVDRLIILPRGQVPSPASESSIVATPQSAPTPPPYGSGFTADRDATKSASLTGEEEEQPPSTELPSIQHTIDPSMARLQEAAAVEAASGKSRAEIMTDLQKQLIQQLDAQASQSTTH
jgi:hypothetical protein